MTVIIMDPTDDLQTIAENVEVKIEGPGAEQVYEFDYQPNEDFITLDNVELHITEEDIAAFLAERGTANFERMLLLDSDDCIIPN